jgi:hypothetical protein
MMMAISISPGAYAKIAYISLVIEGDDYKLTDAVG